MKKVVAGNSGKYFYLDKCHKIYYLFYVNFFSEVYVLLIRAM
jgi:hypothetical protein